MLVLECKQELFSSPSNAVPGAFSFSLHVDFAGTVSVLVGYLGAEDVNRLKWQLEVPVLKQNDDDLCIQANTGTPTLAFHSTSGQMEN